jgi:DNA (cytosine-5)-methyltransferase 1
MGAVGALPRGRATGVLRATDFGSAQLRHRFIVIGTRLDLPTVRVPEPEVPQENWRTVRDAIGDLHGGQRPERIELPPRTTTFFGHPISGAYRSDELNLARRYSDLSLRRFEHVPEGGNRFCLPDELKPLCWLKKHTGAYDVLGRLAWDRPSVTIRTEFFKPEKGRYLHPVDHRALSHHEAARLQGFADDYRWCGSKIQIARQIGNAVPVPLATALARHIAASMREPR